VEVVVDVLQRSVACVKHARSLEEKEHRNAAVCIGNVYKFLVCNQCALTHDTQMLYISVRALQILSI